MDQEEVRKVRFSEIQYRTEDQSVLEKVETISSYEESNVIKVFLSKRKYENDNFDCLS